MKEDEEQRAQDRQTKRKNRERMTDKAKAKVLEFFKNDVYQGQAFTNIAGK